MWKTKMTPYKVDEICWVATQRTGTLQTCLFVRLRQLCRSVLFEALQTKIVSHNAIN